MDFCLWDGVGNTLSWTLNLNICLKGLIHTEIRDLKSLLFRFLATLTSNM